MAELEQNVPRITAAAERDYDAIIGRRPTAHVQRYVQLLGRLPDVQIRTYDDVLDFERAKVDLIKKASQSASDEIAVPRLGRTTDASPMIVPSWSRGRR